MSTAKFRNMISTFNRIIPSERTWEIDVNYRGTKRLIELSGEDKLLREMIDNIDFFLLYRSLEFRSKLRERLEYYEREKV